MRDELPTSLASSTRRRVRWQAIVAILTVGLGAREAGAHGGQYRAPGGGLPPLMPPPTFGPPPPPTRGYPLPGETTPGGGTTPLTPGGGGAGRRRGGLTINTDWSMWWEAHADDYWASAETLPVTTGDGADAERTAAVARETVVVPFLREVLATKGAMDPDLRSATVLALGKTTSSPADVDRIVERLQSAATDDVEREGAAIALGCLRRTAPAARFDGSLLDRVRARLLDVIDDASSPRRVRCFSIFAIGLLGDQPGREDDAFHKDLRCTTRELWTRLADEDDDELTVAYLVALSMQPPAGVPSTALAELRTLAAGGAFARRSRSDVVQSHAVLTYSRLVGTESSGMLLGLVKGSHHAGEATRSAVLALGALATELEAPVRAAAIDALAALARRGSPDTVGFALLSLGRLASAAIVDAATADATPVAGSAPSADGAGMNDAGDAPAGGAADGGPADAGPAKDSVDRPKRRGATVRACDALLDAVDRGSASVRGYAALGLGLAVRHSKGSAATVNEARAAFRGRAVVALREIVEHDGADPDLRGACAIALGLCEDSGSSPGLALLVAKAGLDPILRSRAATGIGLAGSPEPETLATLRTALGRKNPDELRREAARALGALGDRSAVAALVAEVRSDAPDHVRARAAVALGALHATSAIDALTGVVSDVRMSNLARAVAAAALGLVVDPERPRSLARLSADGNFLARTDALIQALSLL